MLLSNPGTFLGRVGQGFQPTSISNCVAWLDMLERGSYTVTAGASAALGTVQSINNLVSGVAWTEVTNPPYYEPAGMAGRPCMRSFGINERLMSTEAAVVNPFVGDDKPFTLLVAYECLSIENPLTLVAMSSSVTNNQAMGVLSNNGRFSFSRRDDTLVTGGGSVNRMFQPGVHIVAVRYTPVSTIEFWIDDESTGTTVGAAADIGVITPTRMGLFLTPDVVPSEFMNGRIGAFLLYSAAVSNTDLQSLRNWLVGRWMNRVANPTEIAAAGGGGLVCFHADKLATSGANVVQWTDSSAGAVQWAPPAGKEPDMNLGRPAASIKLVAANSDCLTNGTTTLVSGALTIALKFKLDTLPAAGNHYILASPKMGTDKWFQLFAMNAVSGYSDWSFSYQGALASQPTVGIEGETLDGSIHTLLVTYSGSGTSPSSYQCWLDGVSKTIIAGGTYTRTTGDKSSLGAAVSSGDVPVNGMDGKLLKFALFNRVLTATEIDALNLYMLDGWRFTPDMLVNQKAWFDLSDLSAYNVVGGYVQNVRNKVSNVVWTEVTNPPAHDANGFGTGLNGAAGNGSSMQITSTEAAVVNTVGGNDPAWTYYAVVKPATNTTQQSHFGYGNSGFTSARSVGGMGQYSSGKRLVAKIDDVSLAASLVSSAPIIVGQPQVESYVNQGTTTASYIDDATVADPSAGLNVGVLTPTRCALFATPASAYVDYSDASIAEVLLYSGAHSDADQRAVTRYLRQKWNIRFSPLSFSSLVGWFDMQNSSAFTTTGTPTVLSTLTDLATGAVWNTAVTAMPLVETKGINGIYPCMKGGSAALGDSTNRGILSVGSPGIYNALSGTDNPFTIFAVTEPYSTGSAAYQALLGAGNSGFNSNHYQFVGRHGGTGRYRVEKTDDVSAAAAQNRSVDTTAGAQVVCFQSTGTTASIYVNTESTPNPNGGSYDVGGITANRCALFCSPDSSPDSFCQDRLGELLVFNTALSNGDRIKVRDYLIAKWSIV